MGLLVNPCYNNKSVITNLGATWCRIGHQQKIEKRKRKSFNKPGKLLNPLVIKEMQSKMLLCNFLTNW